MSMTEDDDKRPGRNTTPGFGRCMWGCPSALSTAPLGYWLAISPEHRRQGSTPPTSPGHLSSSLGGDAE